MPEATKEQLLQAYQEQKMLNDKLAQKVGYLVVQTESLVEHLQGAQAQIAQLEAAKDEQEADEQEA